MTDCGRQRTATDHRGGAAILDAALDAFNGARRRGRVDRGHPAPLGRERGLDLPPLRRQGRDRRRALSRRPGATTSAVSWPRWRKRRHDPRGHRRRRPSPRAPGSPSTATWPASCCSAATRGCRRVARAAAARDQPPVLRRRDALDAAADRAGELRELRAELMTALWIGPSQDLARHWLAGRLADLADRRGAGARRCGVEMPEPRRLSRDDISLRRRSSTRVRREDHARPGGRASAQGAHAIVTLDDPEKLNPLSAAAHGAAPRRAGRAGRRADDPRDRAHRRDPAFSAGGDLRLMVDVGQRQLATRPAGATEIWRWIRGQFGAIARLITRTDKAFIAAVNGPAAGVGLAFALACDVLLLSERARIVPAFGQDRAAARGRQQLAADPAARLPAGVRAVRLRPPPVGRRRRSSSGSATSSSRTSSCSRRRRPWCEQIERAARARAGDEQAAAAPVRRSHLGAGDRDGGVRRADLLHHRGAPRARWPELLERGRPPDRVAPPSRCLDAEPGVRLLAAGGTIAMRGERAVPALDASQLLEQLPQRAAVPRSHAESVLALPSAQITLEQALELAAARRPRRQAGRGRGDHHRHRHAGGARGAVLAPSRRRRRRSCSPAPTARTAARAPTARPTCSTPSRSPASPPAAGLGAVVVFGGEIHSAMTRAQGRQHRPGGFRLAARPGRWGGWSRAGCGCTRRPVAPEPLRRHASSTTASRS